MRSRAREVNLTLAGVVVLVGIAVAGAIAFQRWGWRFAPEGRPFMAVAFLLLAGLGIAALVRPGWTLLGATLVWGVIALWVASFFRDPAPTGPRGSTYLLSPAQGHVVSVVDVDEPTYVRGPATRISIFLSVFDVHVNRYPTDGTVELVHYNPGKFLHAGKDKASLDNEQTTIGIRGPHGPLLVRQIAGSVARRIVTDARQGDSARQAERLGMIRFGSRVDVFLPKTAPVRLRVGVGDKVRVGTTVLGEYAL